MIKIDYVTKTPQNGNDPGNMCNIITNCDTIKLEDLIKYDHTDSSQTIRISQYYRAIFKLLMIIV